MKTKHLPTYIIHLLNLLICCFIFFIILHIAGCASTPPVTPHVIDTDLLECREYEVVNTDTLQLRKKADWPIQHCNGFWAMPPNEAALWKKWFIDQKAAQ